MIIYNFCSSLFIVNLYFVVILFWKKEIYFERKHLHEILVFLSYRKFKVES